MKNKLILAVGLVLAIAHLVACGQPRSGSALHAELRELHSKAKAASSNELTRNGERAVEIADDAAVANDLATDGIDNLSIKALDEALLFFEMAIERDRGNEKALLYLSLLRPFRALRGFLEVSVQGSESAQWNAYITDPFFEDKAPEFGLIRYLSAPVTRKTKNYREGISLFIEPFLKEIEKSQEGFDRLLTNPNFDFKVTLPKDLVLVKNLRIRTADLRMIRSVYLYTYLIGRTMTAYQVTATPPEKLQGLTPEQRTLADLRDPAFGVLLHPNVFKLVKRDILDVIESVSMAEEEFKQRLLGQQNSKRDLLQANSRRVIKCQILEDTNPAVTKIYQQLEVTKGPVCLNLSEEQTSLMLTRFDSWQRRFFDNSYELQMLRTQNELDEFNELVETGPSLNDLEKTLTTIRQFMQGPVENNFQCADEKGEIVIDRVWVDFSNFAEHPVRDLKALNPKFISGSSIDALYHLKDPTFGGLFRPHVPCYKVNQKRRQS